MRARITGAVGIALAGLLLAAATAGVAAAQTIFVPKPKGDETLDGGGAGPAAGPADIVLTRTGERFGGKVVEIAEGRLRMTAPYFDGTTNLLVSALDRVTFGVEGADSDNDELLLANGDNVRCRIKAISSENVVVDTAGIGGLKVPRRLVAAAFFNKSRTLISETRFAAGQMEPWAVVQGNMAIADGALVSRQSGSVISMKLAQKDAITVEAKIDTLGGRGNFNCEIILFAASNTDPYGTDSIYGRFSSGELYLFRYSQNRGQQGIGNRQLGVYADGGVVRLAYDPASGKARAWFNGNDLGEYNVPDKPATGQFLLIRGQSPMKISYVRVMNGMLPPDESKEPPAAQEGDVVATTAKDKMSVNSIALADGQLTGRTDYGEIKMPADKLASITFSKKGLEAPKRGKLDVAVEMKGSRLTVQCDRMTSEFLLGNSETLGPIKIKRSVVTGINFNPYK